MTLMARAESIAPGLRRGRLDLGFARTARGTHLARNFASYPFHITRPFRLDAGAEAPLTLYAQSCSGGLYRGDALDLAITLEAGAACHVTSQASTIVHDCEGSPVRQTTRLVAGPGSFCAFTPDPMILFPSAALESGMTIEHDEAALVLVTDAFLTHDPAGLGRPFEAIGLANTVQDAQGRLVCVDRMRVAGEAFAAAVDPAGRAWRATASALVIGSDAARLDSGALMAAIEAGGALGGAGDLPNGAGLAIRVVAPGGRELCRALDLVFGAVFACRFGRQPAPRRK